MLLLNHLTKCTSLKKDLNCMNVRDSPSQDEPNNGERNIEFRFLEHSFPQWNTHLHGKTDLVLRLYSYIEEGINRKNLNFLVLGFELEMCKSRCEC